MWKNDFYRNLILVVRHYSRISRPPPAPAKPIIRVTNNVAYVGPPKEGPKPRQLLSLPPFPGLPLPGKNSVKAPADSRLRMTAISWVKYYFEEIYDKAIQSHFNKGLVSCLNLLFLA